MKGIAKKVLGLVLTFALVFSSVISPVAVAYVNRCSQKSFPIQSSTHTYSGQSN